MFQIAVKVAYDGSLLSWLIVILFFFYNLRSQGSVKNNLHTEYNNRLLRITGPTGTGVGSFMKNFEISAKFTPGRRKLSPSPAEKFV